MNLKEKVAQDLAKRIQSNWKLGVGTGSTVNATIVELAKRVKNEKLQIQCLATSYESARLCEAEGLTVLDSGYKGELDFGFDGIDGIDSSLCAIKGKGGALLREKLVAVKCKEYCLIGDESKFFADLSSILVPVEVIPESVDFVEKQLKKIGAVEVVLRQAKAKYGAVITEYGHMLLDVKFNKISKTLEQNIKSITGVVESGIFGAQATEALIAYSDRVELLKR